MWLRYRRKIMCREFRWGNPLKRARIVQFMGCTIWVRVLAREKNVLFSTASRPTLGPIGPPVQWLSRPFSKDKAGRA
jgi:hypothetical protein